MKRKFLIYSGFLLLLAIPVKGRALKIDSLQLRFGKFGKISVYKGRKRPSSVIIFAAGDKGWNWRTISMMHSIRSEDEIYVGISSRQYLDNLEKEEGGCLYPASDFQKLSEYVQRKLGVDHAVSTILVGYSTGADLVYGTLCQAPPGTFKGAIVIGFCPDLVVKKPFCQGSGNFEMVPWGSSTGYNFGPCSNLHQPFISLQGMKDQVCNYQETKAFLQGVSNAEVIRLPHTGHLYLFYKRWVPYMKSELQRLKS